MTHALLAKAHAALITAPGPLSATAARVVADIEAVVDLPMRWIVDPGHGWLEVPLAAVEPHADVISTYSYVDRKAGLAYLEEDCDAWRWAEAAGVDKDRLLTAREVHAASDAFVRRLPVWGSR